MTECWPAKLSPKIHSIILIVLRSICLDRNNIVIQSKCRPTDLVLDAIILEAKKWKIVGFRDDFLSLFCGMCALLSLCCELCIWFLIFHKKGAFSHIPEKTIHRLSMHISNKSDILLCMVLATYALNTVRFVPSQFVD